MSYDANIDPIWKDTRIAKNGVRFIRYEDLPEGHPVRLQLGENDAVVIGEFRYVFQKRDKGALVFQNPIKSNNSPNQGRSNNDVSQRQQPQPQPQVVLSLEHIELLKQSATNSRLNLEVVRRIEKLLTELASSGPEQEN